MEAIPRRGVRGDRGVGLARGHVVGAVPLPADEAGLHVDLLDGRVDERPVAHAAERGEVAADEVVDGDVGHVARRDLEVVQVGFVTVSSADGGDGLVVGIHHDVLALAEPGREHASLPPRQIALAFVALHAEVQRVDGARETLKPDQPALGAVDQRAVLTRSRSRGHHHRTRAGITIRGGDIQDRGMQAGSRDEALGGGGRSRRVGESGHAVGRVRRGDAKVKGDTTFASGGTE